MIYRSLSLAALALLSITIISCGSSSSLSNSSIRSGSTRTVQVARGAFPTAEASPAAVSAAADKPRDKHSMPVYSFRDRNRFVRTTAYTCSESDHLAYGSKNATGTPLRYSDNVRSAAADWSFYPVGTTFRIKGLPYLYVVDDYGSALTGTGTIDIYKPSKGVMRQWGRRNVEVNVVQWGSFERSAEILSQRTGYRHCRSMLTNIRRQQTGSNTATAKF